MLDAGGGKRLHGTAGKGVHPNSLRSQIGRSVPHGRFKRCLGDPHRVVVRDNALRSEVRKRQKSTALRHLRRKCLHDPRKRINGHVHRPEKPLAGNAVQKRPGNGFPGGPCNRMQHAVHAVRPNRFDRFSGSVNRSIVRRIQRHHRRLERFPVLLETRFKPRVVVGQNELCPFRLTRLCNPVSNGTFRIDTGNDDMFTCKTHQRFSFEWFFWASFSARRMTERRRRTADNSSKSAKCSFAASA